MAEQLAQDFVNAYKNGAYEHALATSKKVHIKLIREAFYWGCREGKFDFITAIAKIYPLVAEDVSIFLAMAEIENLAVIDWFQQTLSRFAFNFCFAKLCEVGYLSVIKHITREVIPVQQRSFNYVEGLFTSVYNNHVDVCKYLKDFIPTGYTDDVIIQAFRIGATHNSVNAIQYLTTIANCSFDISDILVNAVQGQCCDVALWILQHWPNTINYHFQDGLVFKTLCNFDYYRVVNLLICDDPTLLRYVNAKFLDELCAYHANSVLIHILQIKSLHFHNDEGLQMIAKLMKTAILYGNNIILDNLIINYSTVKIPVQFSLLKHAARNNYYKILDILLQKSDALVERLHRNASDGSALLHEALFGDSIEFFEVLTKFLRVDRNILLMKKFYMQTLPDSELRKKLMLSFPIPQ